MSHVDLSAWGSEPPLFVRLLAAEVAASDRTRTGSRIGMSRTTVSLILANKYSSPSTAGVERRVMAALGNGFVECIAVGELLAAEQCKTFRERPAPTHNPQAMQHWRACQHCPHNPNCTGAGNARIH